MRTYYRLLILQFVLIISQITAYGQAENDTVKLYEKHFARLMDDSQISAQLFLGYQYYLISDASLNEFAIKRGYLTFQKRITPFLSGRITPDITIDREGDGEGDVEMRLKYCFMELKHPQMNGFFAEPSILVGQVFTPWIEFEEKINHYRLEGAHFLDRIKQISSADFGVTITSLIGGTMDSDYQKRVNKRHAGKYGSFALGIYNGGGYHELEKNCNKTFQWRLTLRPLPNYIPGLQVSFTGVTGKGNTALAPEWNMYSGFISFEHELFVATGQYYSAKGDHLGKIVDDLSGKSIENRGYSLFSEIKMFNKKVSIIGRWDYNEVLRSDLCISSRYIVGVAYHISGRNKVLVDYNFLNNDGFIEQDLGVIEIAFELSF